LQQEPLQGVSAELATIKAGSGCSILPLVWTASSIKQVG